MPMGLKLTKQQISEVLQAILTRPEVRYQEIAAEFGLSVWTICDIATKHNVHRKRGVGSQAHRFNRKHKVVPRG